MGILQTLTRYLARPLQPGPTYGAPPEVRQAGGLWVPSYQLNKPAWPEQNVATAVQGFSTAATIFACVTYRAHAVATAQLRAYRGEGTQRAADDEHPVRQLARRPNPQMSEAEFWATVQLIADVTDFCVIEKERADAGNVLNLWPLRSDWLRPIPRRGAPPDWQYAQGGRDWRRLDAKNAIVVTAGTSPTLPITGFGPMRLAGAEGAIIKAMMDYLLGFWQNGALPAYGLVPRDAASEGRRTVNLQADADAMRAKWDETVKAGVPPILWSIERIERLGFDFDELAFGDLHALTDTNVCSAFGVPPILLHRQAGLDAATYSNYGQARTSFYEDTVAPLWARLDGAFTRGLIDAGEFGDDGVELEFDTSRVPALQEDADARRRFVLESWRLRVIDQATTLRHLDFPEVEGTEGVYYAPTTVGLGAEDEEGEEPGEPRSAFRWPDDSFLGSGTITGTTNLPPGFAVYTTAAPLASSANGNGHHPDRRAILPATAEYRARVGDANKQAIGRLAERWAPRIAGFFREQGERVAAVAVRSDAGAWAARVRSFADRRGTKPEWAPIAFRDVAAIDWDEEERLLREVLAPFFEDATASAFALAGDAIGTEIAFDASNPFVQTVLGRLATRIGGIADATRDDVRRVVGEALDEGATLDDLAARLRGLFAETYRGRAMTVARTEGMVAFGHGSVAAYQASGQVEFVEILDNPRHSERYAGAADGLTCAERNGITVPLARATFHVESDHPNGSAAVVPLVSAAVGSAAP